MDSCEEAETDHPNFNWAGDGVQSDLYKYVTT